MPEVGGDPVKESAAGLPVIEAVGVGKRYYQLEERAMLLKSVLPFFSPKKTERWALKDLNLRVDPGETVGLLGRNGAGKTTFLRMLAGVTRPSEGRVTIRGRVAPLISVGVGFHQEMSGRENVYVNGMLLGLSRQEIADRFDEIVQFAELSDYIDTPVKFYSSGMYMRLGFSVASHVEPDVLLVDEVLAVGDGAFQIKCIRRMQHLQRTGTAIVIVSHSMNAVRLLSPRALVLRGGRLEFDGPTEQAIAKHHELMTLDESSEGGPGPGAVRIQRRTLQGATGSTHSPERNERVDYEVVLRFEEAVDTPQVHFQILDGEDGQIVYSLYSPVDRTPQPVEAGQTLRLCMSFDVTLEGGSYLLLTKVWDRTFTRLLAHDEPGYSLYVEYRPGRGGVTDAAGTMELEGVDLLQFEDMMLAE